MNDIPTAEQFLKNNAHFKLKNSRFSDEDVIILMQTFTKLHVDKYITNENI